MVPPGRKKPLPQAVSVVLGAQAGRGSRRREGDEAFFSLNDFERGGRYMPAYILRRHAVAKALEFSHPPWTSLGTRRPSMRGDTTSPGVERHGHGRDQSRAPSVARQTVLYLSGGGASQACGVPGVREGTRREAALPSPACGRGAGVRASGSGSPVKPAIAHSMPEGAIGIGRGLAQRAGPHPGPLPQAGEGISGVVHVVEPGCRAPHGEQ